MLGYKIHNSFKFNSFRHSNVNINRLLTTPSVLPPLFSGCPASFTVFRPSPYTNSKESRREIFADSKIYFDLRIYCHSNKHFAKKSIPLDEGLSAHLHFIVVLQRQLLLLFEVICLRFISSDFPANFSLIMHYQLNLYHVFSIYNKSISLVCNNIFKESDYFYWKCHFLCGMRFKYISTSEIYIRKSDLIYYTYKVMLNYITLIWKSAYYRFDYDSAILNILLAMAVARRRCI